MSSFIHEFKGKSFAITPMEIDISSEFNKPAGTVTMMGKIEGFSVPLYLVADDEDESFSFGYKVIEDGTDTGLFVALDDDDLFEEAAELMANIGPWPEEDPV